MLNLDDDVDYLWTVHITLASEILDVFTMKNLEKHAFATSSSGRGFIVSEGCVNFTQKSVQRRSQLNSLNEIIQTVCCFSQTTFNFSLFIRISQSITIWSFSFHNLGNFL
jgi:hypothetical protein